LSRNTVDGERGVSAVPAEVAADKTSVSQTGLQRRIDATDQQIDQLVYQLYGLTDAEIKIVEDATRR
jgi:hypothetical protein